MAEKNDRALTRGERANLVTRAELGDWKLKLTLLVLDQFSGQRDYCWPKVATITSAMCVRSERTTQEAIKRLKEMGLLTYVDENRGRASRVYSIDYEALIEYQPYVKNLRFRGAGHAPPTPVNSRGAGGAPLQVVHPTGAGGAPVGCKPRTPRGAGGAPITNKQGTSSETPTEQAAEDGGVPKSASQGPVCLSGSPDHQVVQRLQQLIRAKLKAIELLKDNLVWDRALEPLIEIAARASDGNPLPRVMQVIEMADLAKPKLRGAWIKEAIEKGWQPKGRRRGASA